MVCLPNDQTPVMIGKGKGLLKRFNDKNASLLSY